MGYSADRINKKLQLTTAGLNEIKTSFASREQDISESFVDPEGYMKDFMISNLISKNIDIIIGQISMLQNLVQILDRDGKLVVPVIDNEVKSQDNAQNQEKEIGEKDIQAKDTDLGETSKFRERPQNLDSMYPLGLDVIKLRDQLLIAKFGAEDDTAKMITDIYNELGRLLYLNGIEPIEDAGAFNKNRHMVIDICYTENLSLNNTIAETFRPGYCTKHKVIRPQEVILYKCKNNEHQ